MVLSVRRMETKQDRTARVAASVRHWWGKPSIEGDEEMDNDRLNTGQYRDLTERELALVKECKELGLKVRDLILIINDHHRSELVSSVPLSYEEARQTEGLDWLDDAEKQLKIGFMLLVRSITVPGGF